MHNIYRDNILQALQGAHNKSAVGPRASQRDIQVVAATIVVQKVAEKSLVKKELEQSRSSAQRNERSVEKCYLRLRRELCTGFVNDGIAEGRDLALELASLVVGPFENVGKGSLSGRHGPNMWLLVVLSCVVVVDES